MSTESEDHPDQNQEPTSQADRGTYTPILDQPRRKKGSRARPTYLHEQTRRRKPRPAEDEIKSKPGNEKKPPKIVRQKGPKPFARNIVDGYEEKLLESLVPPIIPTPPPETIPTFIGPEFRRLEHPEELSHEGLPKRSGDAGNKPSHQRQRRRWNEKNDGDYGGQGKQNVHNQNNSHLKPSPPKGKISRGENGLQETKKSKPLPPRQEQAGENRSLQNKANTRRRQGRKTAQNAAYVSLSNRYNFNRPAPSVPIPTDRGIKLRSQRGGTSRNWWARRWIEAMERLVDPARLQRGRSYARSGQVLSIQETENGIEAMVQGSRPQPYRVVIQVTHLTKNQWDKVVDAMSEQALFTAQLLAGEMPGNIESAFETAGVSLFPTLKGDLTTSCSCPDWANPCKHIAATHYILGDRFDDDPFLLFRMRGKTQEQIMNALRERRGGSSPETETTTGGEIIGTPGLEELIDHFWESSEELDNFPLTITPPTVDMPLLKRLGEPAFLSGESLQSLLKPVYDSFTRSALRAAYSEEEPIESNPREENGDNGEEKSNQ